MHCPPIALSIVLKLSPSFDAPFGAPTRGILDMNFFQDVPTWTQNVWTDYMEYGATQAFPPPEPVAKKTHVNKVYTTVAVADSWAQAKSHLIEFGGEQGLIKGQKSLKDAQGEDRRQFYRCELSKRTDPSCGFTLHQTRGLADLTYTTAISGFHNHAKYLPGKRGLTYEIKTAIRPLVATGSKPGTIANFLTAEVNKAPAGDTFFENSVAGVSQWYETHNVPDPSKPTEVFSPPGGFHEGPPFVLVFTTLQGRLPSLKVCLLIDGADSLFNGVEEGIVAMRPPEQAPIIIQRNT